MDQQTRIVEFEGKRYQVPQDATLDEIDALINGKPQPTVTPAPIGNAQGVANLQSAVSRERGVAALKEAAPMMGGLVAGAATGGMSIPVQMAATGFATAAGQGIKDTQWGMDPSQRAVNMAKAGAGAAAGTGIFTRAAKLVKEAAPTLKGWGKKLWLKSAKITEPILKDTQTYKSTGDKLAASDEIAETVLSRGLGRNTVDNAQALQGELDTLDEGITKAIASHPGTMDARRQAAAARAEAMHQRRGSYGATGRYEAARDEARTIIRDELTEPATKTVIRPVESHIPAGFSRNPDNPSELLYRNQGTPYRPTQQLPATPVEAREVDIRRFRKVPIQEGQARKVGTYRNETYSADAKENARSAVRKAVAREAKEQIAAMSPEAAAANEQMKRLIPAGKAVSHMNLIQSRREPFDVSKLLFGVHPSLSSGFAAVANSPMFKTAAAQALYNAGKRETTLGLQHLPEAYRAAILASLMASHDGQK